MLIFARLLSMDPMPQAPQPNQYDFILNPQQPPKKPLFGGSMKSRIVAVVAGVIILMIIATIVTSILSSANKGLTTQLKSIVAQQEEIIRIADLGVKAAKGSDARAFAMTATLSVQTDQAKVRELAGKMTPQELAAKKNSKTDELLTGAAANNRYDEALKEILTEQVNNYLSQLKSAFDASSGQKTKTVLSDSFTSAGALIKVQ